MKVCFVAEANNLTGSNRSLLDLLGILRNGEVEPIVLLPKRGPMEEELQSLGVVYYIRPYFMAIKSQSPFKTAIKQLGEFILPVWLAFFLRSKKIDLVHNNSFLSDVGMAAAKRAGIPYICHIRELVREDQERTFIDEVRQINLLKDANAVITISNFVYQKFSTYAPKQNFVTLYNGMNIANYLDEEHDLFKNNQASFLMIGQVVPGKGQLEAVQAANILKQRGISNFTLTIVGVREDNPYLKKIEKYLQSNHLTQVKLVPFVNNTKELQRLRHESDINLICSRAEAMGRVTIESQLAGCLTIGANAGATPELIRNGETGILYNFGDPGNLADKIIYAINHVEEMRKIAKAGQQYAKETYDSQVYAKKMLELYRKVLNVTI